MADNDGTRVPDWSQFSSFLDHLFLVTQTTMDAVEAIVTNNTWNNALQATQAVAERASAISQSLLSFSENYGNFLIETTQNIISALENFEIPSYTEEEKQLLIQSNKLWGQYGWTYIPAMPAGMFGAAPESIAEANELAMQYCTDDDVDSIIKTLRQWEPNSVDLDSAIFCYQQSQYKASALLLCGLIEGKLIQLRSDSKRPVGANAVKTLIAMCESDIERALIEILYTENLFTYLNALFAKGCGFLCEPETLNRNYISHGMSNRSVQKLDCIQLFLALYNLVEYMDLEL